MKSFSLLVIKQEMEVLFKFKNQMKAFNKVLKKDEKKITNDVKIDKSTSSKTSSACKYI